MSRSALLLSACLALTALACHRPEPVARDAGAPFDDQTMAFLSEARALHHEANLKEDVGDVRGAIAAMDRLVNEPRPHPTTVTPEIEEVLADALARKAELELHTGDHDAAVAAAREGLRHAPSATWFRGHLLEVEGVIEESRAASLADAGDEAGASRARVAATTLLEEAVSVQERVIVAALDGGTP